MAAGGEAILNRSLGIRGLYARPGDENCNDADIKGEKDLEGFSQLRWRGFAASPEVVLVNRRCCEYDDQLDD